MHFRKLLPLAAAVAATLAAQSFTPVRELKNLSPAAVEKLHRLETLNALPGGEWRFHAGDLPHGESPTLDDSSWQVVPTPAPRKSVKASKDAIWCRRTVEVPRTLNGYDISGARIWFQFQADANGPMPQIIYFDGRRVALGDDLEPIILFEPARPGDKILVAVKLLHTVDEKTWRGVDLRVETDPTHSSRRPSPDDIRTQIITAANLLPALPTPRKDLLPRVEDAAAAIDTTALDTANQAAFDASLRKSQAILDTLHDTLAQAKIDLVGNSHIDAAWLWPRSETIDVVRRTFTTALQLMDEYPNYTYTQSAAQYNAWMADKYPDLNAQIKQRVKEGRWELVGGMWVEPDLNLPGGESLVRQLLLGQRYFQKEYGVTTRIGWNPDSFGYNWQLPQIYKRSGMDYFVTQKMHWNDTNQLPFRLFWWESPDGSRVLTYFPTDYVHENVNPTRISADFAESAARNPGTIEHMDLYGIGDHGGGPTRTMLDQADKWIAAGQAVGGDVAFRLRNETGTEGASALEANPSLTENQGTVSTLPKTSQTGGDVAFRLRNETATRGALAPEANPSFAANRKGTVSTLPKTSQTTQGYVAFRLRNETGTRGASALEANPTPAENRKGTITTVPKTSQTGGDVAFRLRNETGTKGALAPEANPSPAENRKGTITSVPKTSQTGGDVAFRLRNETGTKGALAPEANPSPAENRKGTITSVPKTSQTGGDVAFRLRNETGTKGALAPEAPLQNAAVPTMRYGTAQQFFTNVEQHLNSSSPTWNYDSIAKGYTPPPAGANGAVGLPTWRDELYFEYHRGVFTTQANHKRNMRTSEAATLDAEKFASLAWLLGRPQPQNVFPFQQYPAEQLAENWKKITFNQFHDLAAGSGIAVIYRDAQNDYTEVLHSDHEITNAAVGDLAGAADTRVKDGVPIILFNSLPWSRSEVVRIPVTLSENSMYIQVYDLEGNKMATSPAFNDPVTRHDEVFARVDDIPAMGYRVIRAGQPSKKAEPKTDLKIEDEDSLPNIVLANSKLKLTIERKTGCITSLVLLNGLTEMVAPGSCANQFQAFVDTPRNYDAWNIDPGTLDKPPVIIPVSEVRRFDNGPVSASVYIKREWQTSKFAQVVSLDANADFIRITNDVDWHEDHVLLKAAFPLAATSGKATFEIPYGSIERPTTRNNSWEKAQFEVPAQQWADLGDEHQGVSIINDSKYGYDAVGTTLRLTLLRSPTWPDPDADRGPQHFVYEIYPHTGSWKDAQTVRRGYELNNPLHAEQTFAHTGSLPPTHSFASVEAPNVTLTAMKKAEDADALIFRMYEWAGKATEVKLHVPAGATYAVETNLMEKPEGPHLNLTGDTITVPIKPYEILTVEAVYPTPTTTK